MAHVLWKFFQAPRITEIPFPRKTIGLSAIDEVVPLRNKKEKS